MTWILAPIAAAWLIIIAAVVAVVSANARADRAWSRRRGMPEE